MANLGIRRAVAEFLVIFFGVTLGLLGDDFRERRSEAKDGEEALALIYEDLLYDSTEIVSLRRPLEDHVFSASWIQSHWGESSIDIDSLGLVLRNFIFANTLQLRSSAFTSLKDGDRLGLIRDNALRTAVIRYYEEEQVRLNQYHELHFEARGQLLRDISAHVLFPPGREAGSAWPLEEGPLRLLSPWSEFRDDSFVYNQACVVGMVAHLSVGFLDEALEANGSLRREIQAKLNGM